MLKIKGTEIQQALTELMVQAVGPYALPFDRRHLEAGSGEHAGDDDAAPLAALLFQFPQDLDLRRLERDSEETSSPR